MLHPPLLLTQRALLPINDFEFERLLRYAALEPLRLSLPDILVSVTFLNVDLVFHALWQDSGRRILRLCLFGLVCPQFVCVLPKIGPCSRFSVRLVDIISHYLVCGLWSGEVRCERAFRNRWILERLIHSNAWALAPRSFWSDCWPWSRTFSPPPFRLK